jgi:transposase InsO family protein
VPGAGRLPRRGLCVGAAGALRPGAEPCVAVGQDQGDPQEVQGDVRGAADPCRAAAGAWDPGRQEAGGAPDGAGRALGLFATPAQAHHDPGGGRQDGGRPGRADFNPEAPDRLWSADITYIWTLEGWLFLSHVEDVFSRKIVGWEMDDHMRKELVIAALEMAVAQRKPEAGCIHHSDKGSQPRLNRSSQQCLLR